MENTDAVIVSAVRTPFGRFDGVLKDVPSIDLGVMVVKEVLSRIQLDPSEVDELYYGTCIPAEYAPYLNVPARQITLLAGFPADSISLTPVSYTHLTLPTTSALCRSRGSPDH